MKLTTNITASACYILAGYSPARSSRRWLTDYENGEGSYILKQEEIIAVRAIRDRAKCARLQRRQTPGIIWDLPGYLNNRSIDRPDPIIRMSHN